MKIWNPMKRIKAVIKAPEIGRVRNIDGLPADIKRACRIDLSRMGPKTKARIRGPGSNPTFRKI